jgi:hypothetical protein
MASESEFEAEEILAVQRQTRSRGARGPVSRPQEDGLLCSGCDKPGNLRCRFRGMPMHEHCHNGVRSYIRTIADFPEAVEREQDLFATDKPAWRADLEPFVDVDTASRKPAINRLRNSLKREERYDDTSKITDQLELTKRRF